MHLFKVYVSILRKIEFILDALDGLKESLVVFYLVKEQHFLMYGTLENNKIFYFTLYQRLPKYIKVY